MPAPLNGPHRRKSLPRELCGICMVLEHYMDTLAHLDTRMRLRVGPVTIKGSLVNMLNTIELIESRQTTPALTNTQRTLLDGLKARANNAIKELQPLIAT